MSDSKKIVDEIVPLEVKVVNQPEKKEESYEGEEAVEYHIEIEKLTKEEKETEELEY